MIFLTWAAIGFSALYIFIQLRYLYHWHNIIPAAVTDADLKQRTGASIIILARNEEDTIGHCIRSVLAQDVEDLPFEIIVINDHSTDRTCALVSEIKDPRIRLFSLQDYPTSIYPPAYKKSGITLAVDQASYPIIITTDADCVLQPTWLRTMVQSMHDPNIKMMTGPVLLEPCRTLLEKMQGIEQLTLMLITGAGIRGRIHDMANGANMAFRKEAFLRVKGYEGNLQYASGDDMFLIEKIRSAFPDGVAFVKSNAAAVFTTPKQDWTSLIEQRLRWAGKNKGLRSQTITRTWWMVGAYHIMLLLTGMVVLLHGISWTPFLIMIISKWAMDYVIIDSAATFFNRKKILRYFIPLQLMYGYYMIRLGFSMLIQRNGDWQR